MSRWWGIEVLSHAPGAMRMDRMKDGGPLLMDHNAADQVGVVEECRLCDEDKKGRATVRFSRSARGEEIFQDVQDGIRKNVSVGYMVHRAEEMDPKTMPKEMLEMSASEKLPVYRITDWEPMEISVVAVPADPQVGIGRSQDAGAEKVEDTPVITKEKERKMSDTPVVDLAAERQRIQKEEKEKFEREDSRREEIRALASRHLMGKEWEDKHIADGTSIELARGIVLNKIGTSKPLDTPLADLSKREEKEYNFLRLIQAQITGENCFEKEVSHTIGKTLGRKANGAFVPMDLMKKTGKRDLSAESATGSYLVPTVHLGGSFVDWLYNLTLVRQLGATVLSGLTSNVVIPAGLAGHAATWVAEGIAATEDAATFRQITLAPNSLSANVDFTKQLILQSSPGIEGLLIKNLAEQFAVATDNAAYTGGGTAEPQGIIGGSGVGSVTTTTATYAKMVNFETDLLSGNIRWANDNEVAFVTTPAVREILKGRLKDTANTASGYICGEDNRVCGYRMFATANMSDAGYCIFGKWSELIIGEFGAMDIVVDPYTQSKAGVVQITALQFIDIALRNGAAFSVSTSVT